MGDTFQPRYFPQPLGTSQYYSSPVYPPPATEEQGYGSGLSQDKIGKIEEMRRLLYKYPQYFTNPVYCSSNGDDRLCL